MQSRTPVPGERRQLLVEGREEVLFFGAFLRELEINEVQIRNCGGKDNLGPMLLEIAESPEFHSLQSIGIVRDADTNVAGAFQSVQSALRNAGLQFPRRLLLPTSNTPKISVFIMPDNANNGALEQLCLTVLADDVAMPCVEEFLQCVNVHAPAQPQDQAKARIHAFLASREDPELRLGEAAQRGYIPWNHPAFADLAQFLRNL